MVCLTQASGLPRGSEMFLGVLRRQSQPVRLQTSEKSLWLDTGRQLNTPRVHFETVENS